MIVSLLTLGLSTEKMRKKSSSIRGSAWNGRAIRESPDIKSKRAP